MAQTPDQSPNHLPAGPMTTTVMDNFQILAMLSAVRISLSLTLFTRTYFYGQSSNPSS